MSLTLILAAAIASPGAVDAVDVAYADLSRGRNEAAIVRIEANADLPADDHARLINLGIAYAREGRVDEARAMFRAALRHGEAVRLETADGTWLNSRALARQALQMLDRGEFSSSAQFAAR